MIETLRQVPISNSAYSRQRNCCGVNMDYKHSSSPVSVVGFACARFSCASDATGSSGTNRSSQTSMTTLSPPRSLLSQLLEKSAGQPQQDDYDDDEDCCGSDVDEQEGFQSSCSDPRAYTGAQQTGSQATQHRSSPIAVPNTIYLKDVNAISELRRIQYERFARRAQMEQMQQQQAQYLYQQQLAGGTRYC